MKSCPASTSGFLFIPDELFFITIYNQLSHHVFVSHMQFI